MTDALPQPLENGGDAANGGWGGVAIHRYSSSQLILSCVDVWEGGQPPCGEVAAAADTRCRPPGSCIRTPSKLPVAPPRSTPAAADGETVGDGEGGKQKKGKGGKKGGWPAVREVAGGWSVGVHGHAPPLQPVPAQPVLGLMLTVTRVSHVQVRTALPTCASSNPLHLQAAAAPPRR